MSSDNTSSALIYKLLILFNLIYNLVKPISNKLGILEEDDEFEEFPVEGKNRNEF